MTDNFKDLLPPEDEIRKLLDKVLKENPSRYPVVVFQIELTRRMVKTFDTFTQTYAETIRRMLNDMFDKK